MNEPSLRKFAAGVVPDGWIFYNGDVVPEGCERTDVRVLARSFGQLASDLGEPRAANMVMLGALLAATGVSRARRTRSVLEPLLKNTRSLKNRPAMRWNWTARLSAK